MNRFSGINRHCPFKFFRGDTTIQCVPIKARIFRIIADLLIEDGHAFSSFSRVSGAISGGVSEKSRRSPASILGWMVGERHPVARRRTRNALAVFTLLLSLLGIRFLTIHQRHAVREVAACLCRPRWPILSLIADRRRIVPHPVPLAGLLISRPIMHDNPANCTVPCMVATFEGGEFFHARRQEFAVWQRRRLYLWYTPSSAFTGRPVLLHARFMATLNQPLDRCRRPLASYDNNASYREDGSRAKAEVRLRDRQDLAVQAGQDGQGTQPR